MTMPLPGQSGSTTPAGRDWVPRTIRDLQQQVAQLRGATSTRSVSSGGDSAGGDTSLGLPTGISVNATAYPAPGGSGSSIVDVTVSWQPPTNSTPGQGGIAGYEIAYALVHPAPSPLKNPAATSPLWGAAQEVDVAAVCTIPKLRSGDQFSVRVRAIDTSQRRTGWAYSAPTVLPTYGDTPIGPSLPVVDSYLGVLRARWDGLDSTGQPMSANNGFDHIEVHWSTSSNFTPSSSTRVGSLSAAGSSFLTTANYGTTYYCRFIAVSRVGNTSSATATVAGSATQVNSQDLFAQCVGSAQLAYAAVQTANINDLAVNDAKIGSLSVGKLTAGYLNAQVLVGNQIATATSGARCVFDAAGLHLYDSSNNPVVDINTNGSAKFTGAIQSGSTITGTNITASTFTTSDNGAGHVQVGATNSANYNRILMIPTNSSYSTGLIGIGEGNTTALLRIQAASNGQQPTPHIDMPANAYVVRLYGSVVADDIVQAGTYFQTTASDAGGTGARIAVSQSGAIGIGSNSNTQRLLFYVANGTNAVAYVDSSGTYHSSTRRIKKNIETHVPAADFADRVRMVEYELKREPAKQHVGRRLHGVIAEEVHDLPDARDFVGVDENGQPSAVAYDRLALAVALSVNKKLNEFRDQMEKRAS